MKAIAAWFWPVHGRTALPPVRQHMEVFAVRMCRAYPDLFLAAVVKVGARGSGGGGGGAVGVACLRLRREKHRVFALWSYALKSPFCRLA